MIALTLQAPQAAERGRAPRLRHELRAIHALVHRDLLRLDCQRSHTALVLLQPAVYLFALGGGSPPSSPPPHWAPATRRTSSPACS
ncbi:hypothetical protein AB0A76_23880 [Streptomyces exfoliatus]|uniref:Uncharacterized protein n=1 Tax=Streptomyces exfoliatus TaxID=1905 RepID=A0ABV3D174_STREX